MSIIAYANPITGKTISKAKTAPPPGTAIVPLLVFEQVI